MRNTGAKLSPPADLCCFCFLKGTFLKTLLQHLVFNMFLFSFWLILDMYISFVLAEELCRYVRRDIFQNLGSAYTTISRSGSFISFGLERREAPVTWLPLLLVFYTATGIIILHRHLYTIAALLLAFRSSIINSTFKLTV